MQACTASEKVNAECQANVEAHIKVDFMAKLFAKLFAYIYIYINIYIYMSPFVCVCKYVCVCFSVKAEEQGPQAEAEGFGEANFEDNVDNILGSMLKHVSKHLLVALF